jgi:hypothetical protein
MVVEQPREDLRLQADLFADLVTARILERLDRDTSPQDLVDSAPFPALSGA